MRIGSRKLSQRIINTTLAVSLVAGSLAASLPLFLSQTADAADFNVSSSSEITSINDAIAAASDGDTIHVAAGDYVENVNVNKDVTIIGEDADSTRIIATNANASPLTFSATGATVTGFTMTHEYTSEELSAWSLINNNGVTFGQGTSSNTLSGNVVEMSRNGVYLNNAQAIITDNVIKNNRTGINATNTINGTKIKDNMISDNWTLGFVYYSSGLATNFDTVELTGNTFSDNWYTQIGIKDTPLSTGTLDVTGNTFTDSPVTYATSSDAVWDEPSHSAQQPTMLGGSSVAPAANYYPTLRIYNSGPVVLKHTPKTLRVGTNQPYATVQAAVNDASAGDTIDVTSDLTVTSQQTVTKPVTLDGNGHKIDGAFVKTDNNNNSVIGIQSDGVTVRNIKVTSSADEPFPKQLHGINVFQSQNVTLDGVNAHDFEGSGFSINYSLVNASNITTSGNKWHAINVDKGSTLNIHTTSNHAEDGVTVPHIFIDNALDGVTTVNDVDNQYITETVPFNGGTARIYKLKDTTPPAVPEHESPANDAYINTNDFWFDWSDVDAVAYEIQNSQSPAINADGSFQNVQWTGDYQRIQPTESRARSVGASGTWYWQVRAVDAAGNKSAWTAPWKVTIDMQAPTSTHDLQDILRGNVTVTQTVTDNIAAKSGKLRIWKINSDGNLDNSQFFAIGDVNVDTENQIVYEFDTRTDLFGDGKYMAKFTSTDKAGNASVVQKEFSVDNTPPVITWNLQPLPYYGIGSSFHVRPRTEEVGTTKFVYIDAIAPGNLVHTVTSDHKNFDTKSEYNQALWDNLTDGSHKFIAVFTDHAGNTATSESNGFIVDRTRPVVRVNLNRQAYIESGDMVRSAAIPEIEAADANLDRIEVWKDGSMVTQWLATTTSRRARINWLGEGTYVIKAYDKAGNQSDEFNLTVENTAPVIHINNAEVVGNPYFKLGEDISIHVADNNLVKTEVNRLNATSDNYWNYSASEYFGLGWLRDGDYSMTSTDAAGNATTVMFRVDHTRPAVSSTSHSGGIQSGSTLYNPVSFTLSANDDSSNNANGDAQSGLNRVVGNIYKYDPTNSGARSDGYYLFRSNSAANPTLTVDLSGLPDGLYYVRYNASDFAANLSNTDQFDFVIDSTEPSVNLLDYSTASNVITPNIETSDLSTPLTYAWTQTSGPTNGVMISDPTIPTPNFTVTESGDYAFMLTSTDAAGNPATATFSFTYIAPPDGEEAPDTITPASSTPAATPVVTTVGQTPTTGTGFTNVATTDGSATDVLGVQTQGPNDDENAATGTLAAAVTAPTDNDSTLQLFGLAWYWWLVILAAGGLGWRLLTSLRRANEA